ncbi:MAG: DUF4342 domain-containing protein [Erysipelotrichales bacterium]|nr:MAG: DUF4342 domain-containing protein [Erysipelotrichales bacterium]
MITIEQVEKVVKHTGATYQEAKDALEVVDGNVLEAIIVIEKRSKDGRIHSQTETGPEETRQEKSTSNGESFDKFIVWVNKMFHKGNVNKLEVVKDKTVVLSIPVTVFILLLIFLFYITLPLLIIGLFFGYGYHFSGPDLEATKVNSAVKMASDATIRAKDAVVKTVDEWSKENKKDADADGKNSDH